MVARATAAASPAASNPLVGLLAGVLSAFGLNTPTAPANPLGAAVWGLFRQIETRAGLTPVAGTPTVSNPDPTTGVVTGTLGFTEPAGQPLTYTVATAPSAGSVSVNPDGSFIYTPGPAARAATNAATSPLAADTFTVTASDGVAATNEAVQVSPQAVPAGTANVTTVTGAAGLVINLEWDPSVSGAPSSFKPAVVQAAQILGAAVSTKITVNIAVGYGEIGGSAVGSSTAQGQTLGDVQESYGTVKAQLTACDTTAIGQSVVAHLPANNPFGSQTYDVSGAQLKAFGVVAPNATALDGEIGFSTDWASSKLVGAALHELTHAIGRNSGWGGANTGYDITPMDLTRYSAPAVLVCDGTAASTSHQQYFSVDGGNTVLADYSTTSDYGDWATKILTVTDPFNAYVAPLSNKLTNVDLGVLDAIGYTTI